MIYHIIGKRTLMYPGQCIMNFGACGALNSLFVYIMHSLANSRVANLIARVFEFSGILQKKNKMADMI